MFPKDIQLRLQIPWSPEHFKRRKKANLNTYMEYSFTNLIFIHGNNYKEIPDFGLAPTRVLSDNMNNNE